LLGSPSSPSDLNIAWQGFYFITGFAHQAVIVFFVLSGFLVGGSVLNDFRLSRFSWGQYLIRRLTRLYPALLAALVCGAFFDFLGYHFFNESGLYTGQSRNLVLAYDASERMTFVTFLGNALMLQTIEVPTFGTNGPLWSLANEFWYYLLFPLCLCALYKGASVKSRVMMAVLAGGLFIWLPWNILIYFVVWLFGASLHLLGNLRLPSWLGVVLFVTTITATRFGAGHAGDLMLGIAVAGLILSMRAARPAPLAQMDRRLAAFSYSLYVMHFPVVVLAVAVSHQVWGTGFGQGHDASSAMAFLCILAIALLASFAISLATEQHTESFRRLVESFVRRANLAGWSWHAARENASEANEAVAKQR
jgi:peptidoglycan/LPS O-acetylase OafA/YrhL